MNTSLFRTQVVPFVEILALLLTLTMVADFLLHRWDMVWLGRYLGIPGTIIILLSFLYSLRKHQLIQSGNPKVLLNLHKFFTWLGALMILIHAGIHFYAILPWLAVIAMLINVISGLVGKFLLENSRRQLSAKKDQMLRQGMSEVAVEREIFWDAVTLDLMRKWRAVHFPITLAFSLLALGHIFSIFLFWQWR